jgi:hypothetical protein
MRGISMRENREARWLPVGVDDAPPSWIARWHVGVGTGREGKAMSRKPEMNDCRESDSCVVPAKLANKDALFVPEELHEFPGRREPSRSISLRGSTAQPHRLHTSIVMVA